MEIATGVARKLPGKWEPKLFSGGALIDGRKAWDEGILLIKAPTSTDKQARAALHTAAQMRVANRVTAIEQTIKDHRREIGRSSTIPTLSIYESGHRRDFKLEALPSDVEILRYVFNARGGQLDAVDVAKLKAANLRATQMPLDLSIDDIDPLARQFMYTAEDYLAK